MSSINCTAGRKIFTERKIASSAARSRPKGCISNAAFGRRKIALAARPLPCCSRSWGVNTNTLSGFARLPLLVLSNAGFLLLLCPFLLLLPLWGFFQTYTPHICGCWALSGDGCAI